MTVELSDSQKEIIDVSMKLFAASEIPGLTIKNLAKKIGFSESEIYRQYENKTQILAANLNLFRQNKNHIFNAGLTTEVNAVAKINHLLTNQSELSPTSLSLMAVFLSELIQNLN